MLLWVNTGCIQRATYPFKEKEKSLLLLRGKTSSGKKALLPVFSQGGSWDSEWMLTIKSYTQIGFPACKMYGSNHNPQFWEAQFGKVSPQLRLNPVNGKGYFLCCSLHLSSKGKKIQAESLEKTGKTVDLGCAEQEVRKKKAYRKFTEKSATAVKQRSWLVFIAKMKHVLLPENTSRCDTWWSKPCYSEHTDSCVFL